MRAYRLFRSRGFTFQERRVPNARSCRAGGAAQRAVDPAVARERETERARLAARIDAELRATCRTETAVRRELGDATRAMIARRGYQRLGFVRLGDYARERLGVAARTLESAAWLAARLEALPIVAAALDRGEVTWTQARTIARVTREHDQDAWLARARTLTAPELEELTRTSVTAAGSPIEPGEDDDEIDGEPAARVRLPCPARLRALWRRAVEVASRTAGEPLAAWRAAEIIAAEAFAGRPAGASFGDRMLLAAMRLARRGRRLGARVGEGGRAALWRSSHPPSSGRSAVNRAEPSSGRSAVNRAEPSSGRSAVQRAEPSSERSAAEPSPPSAAPSAATDASTGSLRVAAPRSWALSAPAPNAPTAASLSAKPGSDAVDPSGPRDAATTEDAGAEIDTPTGPRIASTMGNAPAELPRGATPSPPDTRSDPFALGPRSDPFALDARLLDAITALRTSEPRIGRLLRLLVDHRLYHALGCRSLDEYVRERLGISTRKAWALLKVERRARAIAPFAESYEGGRLSWVRALALLPVINRENADPWLTRATSVTVRRLVDEVDWVLETRDVLGPDVPLDPPPAGSWLVSVLTAASDAPALADDPPGAGASLRRLVPCACRKTALANRVQIGAPAMPADAPAPAACACRKTSLASDGRIGAAPVPPAAEVCDAEVALTAPVSVAALLRDTLDAYGRDNEPRWTALERVLRHVITEWERLPRHRDPVFARDGWRCTVPGCSSRRNLHDHHVHFRSRGGGNARGNRTTICAAHHLHGVHDGTVRVSGTAPDRLAWELGVRGDAPPLLRYVGDTLRM